MDNFRVQHQARLDSFLSSAKGDLSRSKANKLIKSGSVQVNGKVIKKAAFVLKEDDQVSIIGDIPKESKNEYVPTNLNLEILYEDDACFVINKPAGISVHPAATIGKDEKTILNGIAYLFKKKGLKFSPDATLVHRLDKETTGCLLIAKTPEAHGKFQKQFEERTVKKFYLTLVAGVPSPAQALIDAPIGRNLINRTVMSLFRTGKSRAAKTTYKTLKSTDDAALLECELHTGRTHQIRVHLNSINHPILGDPTYCTSKSQETSEKYGITGLCLHSQKLEFDSLYSGNRVRVEAPVPQHLLDTMEELSEK
ncbi:RluA family pseudouridine synthase [Patescibacteria group bacterium]|nr:RluA family pseudouridine synthase [Patescibacteria group bacterium]MBU1123887.1 RluA family pseudouridine synthase [Patescibacteria group bacterium]MBU1910993.1 RluA family pseudouridine synthase [Patescibacteria group bacterium]